MYGVFWPCDHIVHRKFFNLPKNDRNPAFLNPAGKSEIPDTLVGKTLPVTHPTWPIVEVCLCSTAVQSKGVESRKSPRMSLVRFSKSNPLATDWHSWLGGVGRRGGVGGVGHAANLPLEAAWKSGTLCHSAVNLIRNMTTHLGHSATVVCIVVVTLFLRTFDF